MWQLTKRIWDTKDYASASFLLVILVTAGWIIALPISHQVQRASLQRFHLATPNFATWAIQQPVPSMYNFENRFWSAPSSLTDVELRDAEISSAKLTDQVDERGQPVGVGTNAINHFPTRSFTFGFTRSYMKQNPNRFFYVRSRYRDQEIQSCFQTTSVSDSVVEIKQVSSQIQRRTSLD